MKKYFGNIVIQSKNETDDFRAFVNARDSKGQWWELRGYGPTASAAAGDAWTRYNLSEENWELYGCPVENSDRVKLEFAGNVEFKTEDNGNAKIAQIDSIDVDELFIRLQSWDETKVHSAISKLANKTVKITVEEI